VNDIEALIDQVNVGDPGAGPALFAGAYADLRRLARARLRGGGRSTFLDTTALVHESFLRLAQVGQLGSIDRRAYFAYASRVMRSVIVDDVRAHLAEKRGSGLERQTLDTALLDQLPGAACDVLDINEALDALAEAEPRLAQVVEMRYFGGYTDAEIAEALEITDRTVRRDWDKARLLLGAILAN
jgi:RNA polymerase sigma factor (TIGR02999 family)